MVMVMILFGRPEFASYVVTGGKEKKVPEPHLSVTASLNRASSASSRNVTKENKRGYNAGMLWSYPYLYFFELGPKK